MDLFGFLFFLIGLSGLSGVSYSVGSLEATDFFCVLFVISFFV